MTASISLTFFSSASTLPATFAGVRKSNCATSGGPLPGVDGMRMPEGFPGRRDSGTSEAGFWNSDAMLRGRGDACVVSDPLAMFDRTVTLLLPSSESSEPVDPSVRQN